MGSNIVHQPDEESAIELEDAILCDIGETVFSAMKLFGGNSIRIDTGESFIRVDRPRDDPFVKYEDRLREIVDGAGKVSRQSGVEYERVVSALLVLDGWSWNVNVFRTPIWMEDDHELSIDVARRLEGMSWLRGSSLGIKCEQQKEMAESRR